MPGAAKRRYYKELRISQLKAIIELSRSQGFADAAQVLDLSTPTVWQQIRGLEKEFDTPLVEVVGQQVLLTDQGKLLVDMARPVVEGFDAIRRDFAEQVDQNSFQLSVAAPNDVLVYELPDSIRDYGKAFPKVNLSLLDTQSSVSRKLLEEGSVDLAVVGRLDLDLPPSVAVDELTVFPFMLICSKKHPLLQANRLMLKSLAKYPLIMPSEGTNSRRRVESVFTKAGLMDDLTIAIEASTKDLLLKYAGMEFGIAIAPISPRFLRKSDAPNEAGQVAFRDLSQLFGQEHIVILRRRNRHEPSHQTEFRRTLIEAMQKNDAKK